jgi:hypothetical protein
MRRILRLSVILMALVFALPMTQGWTQDTEDETILDNPSQLAGIEFGVSREWVSTIDMSTPVPEGESVLYFLAGLALQFDDDDNAGTAFDLMKDEVITFVTEEFGIAPDDLTIDESDDELVAHGEIVQGDERAYFKYVVARHDQYVFVAATASTDESASAAADDLVDYMADQDDVASGLGDFQEDGSSTGGLWDVFPAADHDLVSDLQVASDAIIHPKESDA